MFSVEDFSILLVGKITQLKSALLSKTLIAFFLVYTSVFNIVIKLYEHYFGKKIVNDRAAKIVARPNRAGSVNFIEGSAEPQP